MGRSTEPHAVRSPRAWPLGRDQLLVLACLGALTALAAAWLAYGFPPMAGARPTMAMSDMAPGSAGAAPFALLAAMWAVMMAGMMLPSATPMILLYAAVQRRGASRPLLRTAVFVTGYVLVWTLFALVAAALEQGLTARGLITPGMALASRRLAGGVLILTGIYEVTPMKQACLRHCRGPMGFVATHWRPGAFGALRMGTLHGAYCLGCCWALMLLLFVAGVMNFAWIVGLAVLVLVQKLLPAGRLAHAMSWTIAAAALAAGAAALSSGP